jgi:threonine synthase
MWKAFEELAELGWVDQKKPRFVVVQAAGCAPIVRAFREQKSQADFWENAHTIADGLRVPAAVADFIILQILYDSKGTALTLTDQEMMKGARLLGKTQGLYVSPESGATVAAVQKLKESGWIRDDERIVLFNTGSGYKYSHLFI